MIKAYFFLYTIVRASPFKNKQRPTRKINEARFSFLFFLLFSDRAWRYTLALISAYLFRGTTKQTDRRTDGSDSTKARFQHCCISCGTRHVKSRVCMLYALSGRYLTRCGYSVIHMVYTRRGEIYYVYGLVSGRY